MTHEKTVRGEIERVKAEEKAERERIAAELAEKIRIANIKRVP